MLTLLRSGNLLLLLLLNHLHLHLLTPANHTIIQQKDHIHLKRQPLNRQKTSTTHLISSPKIHHSKIPNKLTNNLPFLLLTLILPHTILHTVPHLLLPHQHHKFPLLIPKPVFSLYFPIFLLQTHIPLHHKIIPLHPLSLSPSLLKL